MPFEGHQNFSRCGGSDRASAAFDPCTCTVCTLCARAADDSLLDERIGMCITVHVAMQPLSVTVCFEALVADVVVLDVVVARWGFEVPGAASS